MDTDLIERQFALLDDDLRSLGVYVDRHELVEVPDGMVVVVEALFGDVALSQRIIDPDQDRVDDAFGAHVDETVRGEFGDTREELLRRRRERLEGEGS